jgi:hypothetical protein
MAKDLLIGSDNDIIITGGDLKFGENDSQAIERLMIVNKGEVRTAPLVGYGAARLINSRINNLVEEAEVILQLRADRWVNESVEFGDDGQIQVYAERANS